jgi:hypothetical protein
MTLHEFLFIVDNLLILPFWALMIVAPGWRMTEGLMRRWWPVVILAIIYLISIIASLFMGGIDLSQATLDLNGLAYLLGNPVGAATAWLHLLAFDLFVGRWAYLDSRERNLPIWMTSLALFFTLMTGPFGMLLYLAGRGWWERRAGHAEGG